jgi:hypothetical protein
MLDEIPKRNKKENKFQKAQQKLPPMKVRVLASTFMS